VDGAMGIAASGMRVAGTWLAATAHNLANLGTATQNGLPPGAQVPVVASVPGVTGNGATVTAMVTGPPVDPAVEMPNLLMATDMFKLNAAVFARAAETYADIAKLGTYERS
jgi:flagellar basal body rod protein FlgC